MKLSQMLNAQKEETVEVEEVNTEETADTSVETENEVELEVSEETPSEEPTDEIDDETKQTIADLAAIADPQKTPATGSMSNSEGVDHDEDTTAELAALKAIAGI